MLNAFLKSYMLVCNMDSFPSTFSSDSFSLPLFSKFSFLGGTFHHDDTVHGYDIYHFHIKRHRPPCIQYSCGTIDSQCNFDAISRHIFTQSQGITRFQCLGSLLSKGHTHHDGQWCSLRHVFAEEFMARLGFFDSVCPEY